MNITNLLICPLCQKEIKNKFSSAAFACTTKIENESHYSITQIDSDGKIYVQFVILPPYMISTIVGDTKSQIYPYPHQGLPPLIMRIPAISYDALLESDKLIKRIKNLVIFS